MRVINPRGNETRGAGTYAAEEHCFIRHTSDKGVSFEVAEITDPTLLVLAATRTIATSLLPSDNGRVLYFGGFDGAS